MKQKTALLYHVAVFILAQIAWFALLGLWIYRYVSNNIIMEQAGKSLTVTGNFNVFTLVSGIVLFVAVSIGMSLLFRKLYVQVRITKMYNDFIANITHELKTPLASIQLYLETLKIRRVSEEKQQEFVALMAKDASRLERIINSILEVSRLEQRRPVFTCEIHQADSLIPSVIEETSQNYAVNFTGVDMQGEVSCSVVADRQALGIVFDNLFDNAAKYTAVPVTVSAVLLRKEKTVQIHFTDNGIGIDPSDQKKLFSKFRRIYHRDVPKVQGTGLGLYWIRQIMHFLGGDIYVRSRGRGHGTTFILELPVYSVSRKKYINRLLQLTRQIKREQAQDDL